MRTGCRFAGFGPVALSIFPDPVNGRYKDATWQALGEKLETLLSAEEYASAKRTTYTAYYTSPLVIRSMHLALSRLGVPQDADAGSYDITVSATIVGAGGKSVLREGAGFVDAGTGQPGRWGFKVEMNLADLVPGDYVLTLEATSSRRPDQPVRRQIPFAVYD